MTGRPIAKKDITDNVMFVLNDGKGNVLAYAGEKELKGALKNENEKLAPDRQIIAEKNAKAKLLQVKCRIFRLLL